MIKLIATTPGGGLSPIVTEVSTLAEKTPGHITSVAPYQGADARLSKLLKVKHAMSLPAAGRFSGRQSCRLIWSGRRQYLLTGDVPADPALSAHAALTDQSDGWALFTLSGPGTEAVLARLTPLDIRRGCFKRGHAARSALRHMMALFMRTGPDRFEIMVMRSFAKTAIHDLSSAMKTVASLQKHSADGLE